MILIQNLKLRIPHANERIREKAAAALMVRQEEIRSYTILRRSLDARKKPELFFIYTLEVEVKDERKVLSKASRNQKAKEQFSISDRVQYRFPEKNESVKETMDHDANESLKENEASNVLAPIVIGAGPAGLFCTYYLALAGLRPILIEQGKAVEDRRRDVEEFWHTGHLNPSSNVQFGEGGAGTFSDGKLNTLVKDKDGRNRAVLETFVKFGAKECILYDSKPHIGTDELFHVIQRMRAEILKLGARIRFETKMTELIDETDEEGNARLKGIRLQSGEEIPCRDLVLAIGHSARDTFYMLQDKNIHMEQKAFAVGFRVEHPQEMINLSQFGISEPGDLGAAPYKVTAKTMSGRGVYSFCMCPGGYVVNASSEEGMLAVNGMSYSDRNGKNANSAIIVSVTPDDFPDDTALGGVCFQRNLEKKAFNLCKGRIPVERYGDFRRSVSGDREIAGSICESEEIMPQCKGDYEWTDLTGLLPEECNEALVEGMTQFGRQIKGFDREDAILSGIESRTSSPVRILRDESYQCNISGIYPCGEGAGYAGGITSAAMDGLRVAEEICKKYFR